MIHIVRRLTQRQQRTALLTVVVALVIGSILLLNDAETGIAKKAEIVFGDKTQSVTEKEKEYPRAREIVKAAGFINTDGEEIRIADYIGEKVILVDFWTYSCINCQRTQPYLNAWQEKYADDGLLILGVHTPEFEFEEKYENVLRAVKDAGIQYPVVQDNEYGTWSAYQNRYWPRKYLIDIDGFIVYDHIGEGNYEETEMKIQELLEERAVRLGEEMREREMIATPAGVEGVDRTKPRTPEIYFGALRNADYLGNGTASITGEQTFEHPGTFVSDKLYLGGVWNITPEYARGSADGTRIILPYRAQKVFMVASSKDGARVQIYVDGKRIDANNKGVHVNADGTLDVQNEQLYRIIESSEYGTHILEIVVEEGVIDAFSFTFG